MVKNFNRDVVSQLYMNSLIYDSWTCTLIWQYYYLLLAKHYAWWWIYIINRMCSIVLIDIKDCTLHDTKAVGDLQCSALGLKRTSADIIAYSKTRTDVFHKLQIIFWKLSILSWHLYFIKTSLILYLMSQLFL